MTLEIGMTSHSDPRLKRHQNYNCKSISQQLPMSNWNNLTHSLRFFARWAMNQFVELLNLVYNFELIVVFLAIHQHILKYHKVVNRSMSWLVPPLLHKPIVFSTIFVVEKKIVAAILLLYVKVQLFYRVSHIEVCFLIWLWEKEIYKLDYIWR